MRHQQSLEWTSRHPHPILTSDILFPTKVREALSISKRIYGPIDHLFSLWGEAQANHPTDQLRSISLVIATQSGTAKRLIIKYWSFNIEHGSYSPSGGNPVDRSWRKICDRNDKVKVLLAQTIFCRCLFPLTWLRGPREYDWRMGGGVRMNIFLLLFNIITDCGTARYAEKV